MWRKSLYIDTRFSQVDSTDSRQNQQQQLEISNIDLKYKKDQAIINFMTLDFYFRGITILDNMFDQYNRQILKQSFGEIIKAKDLNLNIKNNQDYRNFHKKQAYENQIYKRSMREGNDNNEKRKKESAESLDRMNLLNNIADRILETKRIKSQSKISASKNSISVKEGRKIISKLEKLQKMIKSIKKQNQMSNQASIVYVDRNRNTYHQDFVVDNRYLNRVPIHIDRIHRYPESNRHSQHFNYHNHRNQHSQSYNPYSSSNNYSSDPSSLQMYYQQLPIRRNQMYRQKQNDSDMYQQYGGTFQSHNNQRNFIQDQSEVQQQNIIKRLTKRQRRQESQEDEEQQEESDSMIQKQKDNVNQQIQNIKQQLNQLKKMNLQYIQKNALLIEQSRSKGNQKYSGHKNVHNPSHINHRIEPRKVQSAYIKKGSMPKSNKHITKHPVIPMLNLKRKNESQFSKKQSRNFDQVIEEPKFYTHRSHHPYNNLFQCGNYPISEYHTEREHLVQNFRTPVNIKHDVIQMTSNVCGQCGCRCHIHQNKRKQIRYQDF